MFQEFANDIAEGINEHAHRDIDVAVNPGTYGLWDVRTYFV
jgi:hypothetical protein